MVPLVPPLWGAVLGTANGAFEAFDNASGRNTQGMLHETQLWWPAALLLVGAVGELAGVMGLEASTPLMLCGATGLTKRLGIETYDRVTGHGGAASGAGEIVAGEVRPPRLQPVQEPAAPLYPPTPVRHTPTQRRSAPVRF